MGKIEIDKNELYRYYIVENHSRKETASYFNIGTSTLQRRLKEYGIDKIVSICLPKDDLYKYYIIEGHSQIETAKHFSVSDQVLRRILKEYGFTKRQEIEQETLYQYYIIENHNQIETAEFFNVSKNTIRAKLKEYSIKKTKEQIQDGSRKKCQEKYGVPHPQQSPKIQAKTRTTNQKKYGHEYVGQVPEFKKKREETCLKIYGFKNPSKNSSVKKKIQKTWSERPLRNCGYTFDEIEEWLLGQKENGRVVDRGDLAKKMGILASTLGNYLKKHPRWEEEGLVTNFSTHRTQEEEAEIEDWLIKRGANGTTLVELEAQLKSVRPETAAPNGSMYIIRRPHLKHLIKYYSSISEPQHEVYEFIKENYDGEIREGDRKVIAPKEIDILLPELKLGIEFNGLYHHRTMRESNIKVRKDKYYHRDKALRALEKGYRLYFITDDEWRDSQEEVKTRILDMLANKQDVSNILGYTEPNYCYTDGRKRYFLGDSNLPKALTAAFALEDDDAEWEYAESKGYYRYYDCGEVIFKDS